MHMARHSYMQSPALVVTKFWVKLMTGNVRSCSQQQQLAQFAVNTVICVSATVEQHMREIERTRRSQCV